MTSKRIIGLLCAGTLLLQPLSSQAAESAAAPAPKGPSAFVRCDGNPNKPSTLGTVARLIALSAVVGLLIPPREEGDVTKRQNGADGIKACDEALTGPEPAKDGGRRIELFYGRAIHRMETGDWDGAIADLRAAEKDQPAMIALPAYKQSLGLTALHLEAMALTGKGDYAAAHAAGLRLADQAPYDMVNMLRAIDYIRLADGMNEGKERYYSRLVQIYPIGLKDRGEQLSAARRFAEAARDYLAINAISASIPAWSDDPTFLWSGRAAVAQRLAGNVAEAESLIAKARTGLAAAKAAGKYADPVSDAEASSDMYDIIAALEGGQAVRARMLFSARSGWGYLPAGFSAELSRRLAKVGTPEQQAMMPIKTPEEILKAERDRRAAVINDPGKDNQDRFNTYRPAFSQADLLRFANNTWRPGKSKYISDKPDKDMDAAWVSVLRDGSGSPSGYAFFLHLALQAKAQSKSHFMLVQGSKRYVYQGFARIGDPGDKGIVPEVLFDADQVIADISPLIPRPVPSK